MVDKINTPITKFGGLPIWVEDGHWPLSDGWQDRKMMFVGQIALEKGMLWNGFPVKIIKNIICFYFKGF